MATPQQAFQEAADRLSALALKVKLHYEEEREGEEAKTLRDALSKLGDAVEDAFQAMSDAAKDDAVREDAKDAARSVGDAFATAFSQVADELKDCFNRKEKPAA